MEQSRFEDKLDDLIVRINRIEMAASALGEKHKEHSTLMTESLSQLKVMSHAIEGQVRLNQIEIAKLMTQAKLAGGVVGVIAGAISGLLSSLFGGR